MDVQQMYENWLTLLDLDDDAKAELHAFTEAEKKECFGVDLAFGTGGLRGVLGLGNNRMNIYTVRKATQGLADYLGQSGGAKSVAIAYDSRINSDVFAKEVACVLAANGVQVWIYPRLMPTPALSWAVREQRCSAGVCITASHNPGKYNGYKVYGADGCQITLEMANDITGYIAATDIFQGIRRMDYESGLRAGLIQYVSEEILDGFIAAVKKEKINQKSDSSIPLKVVYTPLNGAGLECVERILKETDITDMIVVPEQREPDGRFLTCPYPNPEIQEAMQKGLELCEKEQPDLLLATDPDCDRCGLAVPTQGRYELMTGNEVGILLLDYICKVRTAEGTMPLSPVAVTTIVSSAMADPVAEKYGIELRRTLTGFKFIGEQIGLLEQTGDDRRFIFGFEESYGYLSGSYVRDKDAVNAAMLICEMARYYKGQGKNLFDVMQELYAEHGVYQTFLYSAVYDGLEGMAKMEAIMQALRQSPPEKIAGYEVRGFVDYQNTAQTGLPAGDVLEFQVEGENKLIVRPSGTEPKIKVYVTSVGDTLARANEIGQSLAAATEQLLAYS